MNILQLCKKFPYPLHSGEAVAVTYLARALHEHGATIDLLSMKTTRHPVETTGVEERLPHYRYIRTAQVDNRIKPLSAFYNLLLGRSYHVQRFVSKAYREALVDMLRATRYDVVQLETLYLAPYIDTIRAHSNAAIVMRSHNVEAEIWERISDNARGIKRWYLRRLTRQLYRYERKVMHGYDLLLTMSDRDTRQYRKLGYTGVATVIPIGLDMSNYQPSSTAFIGKPSLAFIGTLDWQPNIEGLSWFLNAVWPAVLIDVPHAELYVAGKGEIPDFLYPPPPNVTIVGEVASATEFMDMHAIHIVPLLSGSGMRVKILEAMAMARVVIATAVGIEGIAAEPEEEAFVAYSAEQMSSIIISCVSNSQLQEIGYKARARIIKAYNYSELGKKVLIEYTLLKSD